MEIRDQEFQEPSPDSSGSDIRLKTLEETLAWTRSSPLPYGGDAVVPSVVAVGGLAPGTLAEQSLDPQSPDPLDYLFCGEFDGAHGGDDGLGMDCLANGISASDLCDVERPSWSASTWSPMKESRPTTDSLISVQESKPAMVGAGLVNLGNTCFLNAVMQCFTHTVPLVEGLRSCNHPKPCERGFKEFCVLCAFRDHVHSSLSSSGGIISPLNFVDNLNYFSSSFTRYGQEDAHEFLQCFLDKLERSLMDPKTVAPPGANLVERVFGGRLISKLECCNCGHCSETFEPLIDLSLEIEEVDSLPKALGSFTKVEKIEDSETKFQCRNCKEEVAVAKQLVVDKAPSVAVFHLKRFKADGRAVEKIDKHVEFPLELDLQSYTVSANGDDVGLKYDLYGIVVHEGFSPTSGHYFSFIRSSSNTWHSLDDSRVSRVSEEYVLGQDAYILFYARRGTPWFSSLMEPPKSSDPETRTASPKSVLDNVENASPVFADIDALVSSGATNCLEKVECSRVDICTVTPLGESDCHQGDEKASKADVFGPRTPTRPQTPGENDRDQVDEKVGADDVFHPLTPPRPQTPDFPSFESPGSTYQIPRNHLKSEERAARKRMLNKSPADSEKKEAVRYLTRSMPSSRGSKLMEALFSPRSEGAIKKKRKLAPCKTAGTANDCHKSNHASVTHPVAALMR